MNCSVGIKWLNVWMFAIAIAMGGCKSKGESNPSMAPAAGSAQAANVKINEEDPSIVTPLAVEPARRLWTPELRDEAALMDYSKELGGERFTKFVLDLRSDQSYYFDVDVYRVHKEFVFAELLKIPLTPASKKVFDLNYSGKKPEFALCYLVHHLSADKWTLAFWAGDRMTAEHVRRAYTKMKDTFYLGDKVAFRPDSARQEKLAKTLKDVPVIYNNQIYQTATYQAFASGAAVGKLRIVQPGADESTLTFATDEIVLMHESLSDITPVAGIIAEEFSTPLSHVSLRARAWGIPNIGLKDAIKTYQEFAGKIVYFEAKAGGHQLRLATEDEMSAAAKKRDEAKVVVVPKADLSTSDLRPLSDIRGNQTPAFGAKAANLGEMVHRKPKGFVVPPGFGIPISFYQAHLKNSGVDATVSALLSDTTVRKDPAARKTALEVIRKAIVDAPIDEALMDQVESKIAEQLTMPSYGAEPTPVPPLEGGAGVGFTIDAAGGGSGSAEEPPGFFVRSSTTVEDLPGFNGAGLYDTMPNVRGRDNLALAIKKVWASVWNLRAFDEREFYGIDQTAVYGAILVQRAAAATSAGVMITAHPTDPLEKTTFTINAKKGFGMNVVDGKKVPEILLYNFHNDALRIVSRSAEDTMLVSDPSGGVRAVKNPNPGKAILSALQARLLGRAGQRIIKAFPKEHAVDIEWVFVGDELNIVQARPYVSHELQ
jgi:Pyruvate phosphate dikinase, AMP/ATP-binding domain